jgi:hypothetical protein
MGSVATLCKTGLILSNGIVSFYGNIDKAIDSYIADGNTESKYIGKNHDKNYYFDRIIIENVNGISLSTLGYRDETIIKYEIGNNSHVENATLSFTVLDSRLNSIFTAHTSLNKDQKKYSAKIPSQFLLPGTYYLKSVLHVPNQYFIDVCDNEICLNIEDTGSEFTQYTNNSELGVLNADIKWI